MIYNDTVLKYITPENSVKVQATLASAKTRRIRASPTPSEIR